MKRKIGVYVCHCGSNIAGYLDVEKLTEFAAQLPAVAAARHYTFMCSDPGQDILKNDIRELGLNGVLVCSCSPTLHLRTFRDACAEAGLNPYLCDMATIREHCSWVHSEDREIALDKAKALVAAGLRRVLNAGPLVTSFAPVTPETLVVGAGIAGIQTALEIAATGNRVYLVEKQPFIGGKMAQLDTTFPYLDKTSEMLVPRMQMAAENENITIFSSSEVIELTGYIGNFKAVIVQKPRSVDETKCNGCGECWNKCPVEVRSEFDHGLRTRKAIYVTSSEAIPHIPAIDREHCKFFTEGSCHACADVCPTKAIDFQQTEKEIEVDTGTCVIATGYDTFEPSAVSQLGWGRLDNVLTSPEFERILADNGPTGGKIVMKNGNTPKSIVIAHCVGSRDQNYYPYCSRVCCMYSLKYARLIKQRLGPDTAVYQMYIDMRCFGKGHEEFYQQACDDGVQFIRGKIGQVTDIAQTEDEKGRLIAVAEDTMLGTMIRVPTDMVVLSVAMKPREDSPSVARTFLLGRSADGFYLERHPKLDPVGTMVDGVFSVGCCQGPKDIADTIAQATGAAARALALISRGKVQMEPVVASVDEDVCAGCGCCEAVCAYRAVEIDAGTRLAKVNEAVCKGCGACAVNCPSKAMQLKNFSPGQFIDVIDEATRDYAELAE